MGCGLALQVVTSLVAAVTAQADLELRTESRATTLSVTGAPQLTRESAVVEPRLAGRLEDADLRATAEYRPRIWTSDLEAAPSPLVDHTVTAAVRTTGDRSWRLGVSGDATRGKLDPLSDILASAAAASPSAGQLATTAPIAYEMLHAGGEGELQLSPRTTLGATGSFGLSRGADAEARRLLPPQRMAGGGLSGSYLLTPLDTLRLSADGMVAVTQADGGDMRSSFATGSAAWRRRLSPALEGRLGAGASILSERPAVGPNRVTTLPYAAAGLTRPGDEGRIALDASVRWGPEVDRFTGEVNPMINAAFGVRWQAARDLAVSTTLTGGARDDGVTTLGSWDARAAWTLRDRLALEFGLVGLWQRDRRPGIPSLVQAGAVVAMSYGMSVGGGATGARPIPSGIGGAPIGGSGAGGGSSPGGPIPGGTSGGGGPTGGGGSAGGGASGRAP